MRLQGENDEFGSVEQIHVLKKEILASVVISEILNDGHTPRKEAEEETMKLVSDWIVDNKI